VLPEFDCAPAAFAVPAPGSFPALSCEFATLDVSDALGTVSFYCFDIQLIDCSAVCLNYACYTLLGCYVFSAGGLPTMPQITMQQANRTHSRQKWCAKVLKGAA